MTRKSFTAGLIAAVTGATFAIVAPRVDAATAVTVSGTTITVTDTDGADVHRLASGETVVDGVVYPDRPNLVVKSLASPTVLLDSTLTGNLTISMPPTRPSSAARGARRSSSSTPAAAAPTTSSSWSTRRTPGSW